MRGLFLLVVVAMFSVTTLSAQGVNTEPGMPVKEVNDEPVYGKNEIRVSYGALTFNQGVNLFVEIITLTFAQMDINLTGSVNIEYLRYLQRWASVGVSASYEYGREGESAETKARHHYITLMPTSKLYWLNRAHFGMYSRLGVGATYVHGYTDNENTSHWRPAFQLSGVCLEAGGDSVRGYLELGWGTQGFVQLGISTRF